MADPVMHTAGPWMMAARPSSIVGWPVVGHQGASICSLSWIAKKPDHVSDERFAAYRAEVEANGRLIAAAPKLLSALQALTYGLPDLLESIGYADEEDLIGEALAAISSATGEAP